MTTILIVDDRPLNREFLTTLLGYGGYRLLEAANGAEALALARTEHPDLMITDVRMPGMDGYELVNQLRAEPALAEMRVIFYTATYRTAEARTLAEACGVTAVLGKPSSPEEILAAIHEALGAKAEPLPTEPVTASAPPGGDPLVNLTGQLGDYLSEIESIRQVLASIVETGLTPADAREQWDRLSAKLAPSLSRLQSITLRLATLVELGLELSSQHDPEQLLETFCRAVQHIGAAEFAVVGLLTPDGERLQRLYAWNSDNQPVLLPDPPEPRTGILGQLLSDPRPRRLANPSGAAEHLGLPTSHPPVRHFLGLPIVSASQVYGWLYLVNKLDGSEFGEIDQDIAATITSQVATAYENLRLYAELQRRADALQAEIGEREHIQRALRKTLRARAVMAECNHALIHAEEEHQMFDHICKSIVKTGNYPMAWIGAVREDNYLSLAPVAHAGREAGCLKEWRYTRTDTGNRGTPVGRAIRTGMTVMVPDLKNETRWGGWREHTLAQGYRSMIALPLKDGVKIFGTLSIYDSAAGAFGPDEVSLLEELADDIAYGVNNLRTQAARERAEQRLATQYTVARLLAESATLSEAVPEVLRVICETLNWDIDVAELWLVNHATAVMRRAGIWRREDSEAVAFDQASTDLALTPGMDLAGEVWQAQHAIWIADLHRESGFIRAEAATQAGLRAGFGFPVRFEGRVLGAIALFSREIRQPKDDLMSLFAAIGNQIGLFVERKRTEEELRISEDKLSSILGSIDNIVWSLSATTSKVLYLNAAAERVWGRPVAEFMADHSLWLETVHPEDRERMRGTFKEILAKGVLTTEYRVRRPDGEIRWLEDRVKVIYSADGQPLRLDGVASDITDRKRYEANIEYLATHDALTRLPNRTLLADRMRQALAHARRTQRPLALFFLDLDRFKDVNDSYGHVLGDSLLQAVGERLSTSVREGDTVARQGGDEFLILLADLEKMEDIERVAIKVLRAFGEPFLVEGRELFMSGSIGASVFPADGEDMDTLLKHADTAMYRAKEEGGNGFRMYARNMSQRALDRIRMENALRHALEEDQFELYYQPKVELRDGLITGAEALIRWHHPELGLVSPARFIPLAEETGLIHPIGIWALRTACLQSKHWQESGLAAPCVAVNLSARQVRSNHLVELVTSTLNDIGLAGHYLELELTESMVMQNPEQVIPILRDLKDLGVEIAVDDFGTGYSSLSYLKRFPFDRLKIDQSFVRDIATDSNDAGIVQTVISLGHILGLKVIAEGVETLEQLAFLCQHRCDEMQGYYLSRPIPADEFACLLRDNRRLTLPSLAA